MTSVKHEKIADAANIHTCLNCTSPKCSGDCWKVHNSNESYKKPLIRCRETGDVFRSAVDAAAFVGLKAATMRLHLKGETSHCGGLHFNFVTT
jgi:hypothetical protein